MPKVFLQEINQRKKPNFSLSLRHSTFVKSITIIREVCHYRLLRNPVTLPMFKFGCGSATCHPRHLKRSSFYERITH